jgi:DNA-binding XRE family transcriptional regulator
MEMNKVRLENVEIDLKERLKDPEFRRIYELECAKVALAQKIAVLREDKHLRQSDLARKMGVSQQFISQIETGDEKNLTIETLMKIAKSLGRGVRISFPKISKNRPSCLEVT